MQKVRMHLPAFFGLSVFLLAGVVYAQVVPEAASAEVEEKILIEQTTTFAPEETPTEQFATTSPEETSAEKMFIESASSTANEASVVSGTTTLEEGEAPDSPLEMSLFIQDVTGQVESPIKADEFHSIDDFVRPAHCQSDSAQLFFATFNDCVRHVITQISQSKLDSKK